MAIVRLRGSARAVVPEIEGRDTLYEVELSTAPSLAWRAAFLRPPPALTSRTYTPDIGRITIRATTLHFRTDPARLLGWLRRIDRWIRHANSIVEE